MRTLFILIFSFILSNGINGQETYLDVFPQQNGKVTYSAVIQTEGFSKDELHKRAKRWVANNCETIKIDDEDLIVCQGVFVMRIYQIFGGYDNLYVTQTMTIQLKDGRYKYEISDFRLKHYSVSSGNSYFDDDPIEDYRKPICPNKQIKQIDTKVKDLIASLDQAMKTPIDDNW